MTRRDARVVLLVAALALPSGCASDPFAAAMEAQGSGHWEAAYTQWRQLLAEAEADHASDEELAVRHYNLGRAAGATCRFDEAERELLRAAELDARTNGPSYMALFELANLNLDQRKWTPAIGYYERAIAEYERVQGKNGKHPAITAFAWDDYAIALRGAGRDADAAAAWQRARELRQLEQARVASDRTPYGNYCAPGQAHR